MLHTQKCSSHENFYELFLWNYRKFHEFLLLVVNHSIDDWYPWENKLNFYQNFPFHSSLPLLIKTGIIKKSRFVSHDSTIISERADWMCFVSSLRTQNPLHIGAFIIRATKHFCERKLSFPLTMSWIHSSFHRGVIFDKSSEVESF